MREKRREKRRNREEKRKEEGNSQILHQHTSLFNPSFLSFPHIKKSARD